VASPRTDLRAVADVSEERQDFVRNSYPSVRVGGLPGDVLGDPQIEAVVVATPAASHFDLAIKAIEAGKHVLIEKPMARTAGEVREIGKRGAENDVVAMVGLLKGPNLVPLRGGLLVRFGSLPDRGVSIGRAVGCLVRRAAERSAS
jgi:predicted dehydrogenase